MELISDLVFEFHQIGDLDLDLNTGTSLGEVATISPGFGGIQRQIFSVELTKSFIMFS